MGSPRALAIACALLLISVANAQPNKPTDAQTKKAGDLVRGAIAKSQAGDHSAAIDLYLNAYQLVPLPVLLSNIGSEYQQVNKPVQALKYFCKYLETDPTGTSATYATAQAKTLQIELNGSVDEKHVCKPVVKPAATPPPPPPPDLTPTVNSSVSAPEFGPAGGPQETQAHEGRSLKIAGLAATGVGAVLFGVGIYYGIDGQRHADFENNYKTTHVGEPWPANIRAYEQEGRDDNTKQAIFMVAGGVAIAAGVAVYVLGRHQATSGEYAMLHPVATANSAGLALTGAF